MKRLAVEVLKKILACDHLDKEGVLLSYGLPFPSFYQKKHKKLKFISMPHKHKLFVCMMNLQLSIRPANLQLKWEC